MQEIEKGEVLEIPQEKKKSKLMLFIVTGIIIVVLAILAILGYVYFTGNDIPTENLTGNGSETANNSNFPVPNITDINGTMPATQVKPSCTDKIKNGDESGVDCGGKCKPCSTGGGGGGGGSGETCTPDCSGKQCGDNGCGSSCGSCNTIQYCNATGQCAITLPTCENDYKCSSVGKFCDANTVYNCTLGSDGCFDRTNETICNSSEICIGGACAEVHAVFADNQLVADCNGNYSITNRDCNGGDGDAYKSLADATAGATVGDTVLIRGGTYNELLKTINSGIKSGQITYKNYPGESVAITGTAYDERAALCPDDPNIYYGPVWMENVNYIVIDGLNFSNYEGFGRVVRSNNNSFKNCNFYRDNSGWIIGLNLFESNDNKFENNFFKGASDNFRIIHSERNVIENNEFYLAGHVLLTLKCSSYNIIRNNYFYNELQKAVEIYDCEQPTMEDHYNIYCQSTPILNSSIHNLIESNEFAYTAPDDGDGPFNHIQYAGQDGIIRNNLFYNSNGIGIGMTRYPDEALYNKFNRVYDNVFYNNMGGGISTSRISPDNYDNIYKNNIFYKNYPGPVGWADNYPSGSQITHGDMANFLFECNDIINSTPGQTDIIYDYYNHRITLAQAQATYPLLYRKNIEAIPLFVNETSHDFHLQSSSPMIDAGAFLTGTPSAGSGTTMQVNDSRYFYDGFGISGEVGDVIQLDNGGKARITNIDYDANTLTLNQSLTWVNGQNVSLAYSGSKPDIGAYESGGIGGTSAQSGSLHSEQAQLSWVSQIYNFFKGLLTGNTIKEITGYFLRIKA